MDIKKLEQLAMQYNPRGTVKYIERLSSYVVISDSVEVTFFKDYRLMGVHQLPYYPKKSNMKSLYACKMREWDKGR